MQTAVLRSARKTSGAGRVWAGERSLATWAHRPCFLFVQLLVVSGWDALKDNLDILGQRPLFTVAWGNAPGPCDRFRRLAEGHIHHSW